MKKQFKITSTITKSNLESISKSEILEKNGQITFNWYLEQIGNFISWTCEGYIGNNPITLVVHNR